MPEPWERGPRRRHHVMQRLARYFHVVWIDRPQGWRATFRSRFPFGNTFPSLPGFHRYRQPRYFPHFHRPRWLGDLMGLGRLRQARRYLRGLGCSRIVLYLARPEFHRAPDLVPHDLLCYHVDDEYTFSDVEQPTPPHEAALLRRAGLVVIHSPGLLEKKGGLNPKTIFVPNGVEYEHYATPQPEPYDMRGIPHPRIGYVGIVKKQMDFRLLDVLSARHPEWQFVLVGPDGNLGHHASLRQAVAQRANVHFLGKKAGPELAAYTQHFDVGMMCYEVNGYTKFIYPLKLHEYLAAGVPVVGSPIRTILDFRGLVEIADTPDEWSAAIARCLDPAARAPAITAERRATARRHDWDGLVATIAHGLAGRLGCRIPV
jgi:glycosyltransferase involved in cell wall biosynthesis